MKFKAGGIKEYRREDKKERVEDSNYPLHIKSGLFSLLTQISYLL